MSNPIGGEERDDEVDAENKSDEVPETSSRINQDAEEDGSDSEPLFEGVEEVEQDEETVDRKNRENEQTPGQPPAATALNELAEGESLTDVLTVALEEWREIQQIGRQREEAEFKFQQRVITIGTIAVVIVVGVSSFLSYTGNLPGSSFAFILGTLFGSLGTILQSLIRKHQYDV
jgi:hypothetical protein